ncbi:prepilin peptidase [Streptomyces fradiae]|uniref:prepilin peptidase n=1 Tax=Streptomyces fradiae TaxID=1906 RepID=UPI003986B13A
MYATLMTVAALWGAAAGLAVRRAAHRFAVEPDEPWRDACPAGHPYVLGPRGWMGPAHCPACVLPPESPAPPPAPGGPASVSPAPPRASAPPPAPTDAPAPPPDSAPSPARRDPAPPPAAPLPDGLPDNPIDNLSDNPSDNPSGPRASCVVVPVAGAVGCALLAGATGWRPELAVWLLLAPFALLLAVVDRRVHRLPDPLTLPLAAAVPLLLGVAALLPGHAGSWWSSVQGGLALGGTYLVLFLVNPNGMGFGDVKLAAPLGAALGWYGWPAVLVGAFAGFVLGGAYGLGLVLRRRATRGSAIPFGPFMIAGAVLGLALGALAS